MKEDSSKQPDKPKKIVPNDWNFPTKTERWKKLCEEIGARFIPRVGLRDCKVEYEYKEWILSLEHRVHHSRGIEYHLTRLRAPFKNASGLRFFLYREGFFSKIGKKLGMQDIIVGHSALDKDFIIQGNNENKVKELFSSSEIAELLNSQSYIELIVRNDAGVLGPKFPEKTDLLCLETPDDIRDIDKLKEQFSLLSKILDRMTDIGVAFQDAPRVKLDP